LDLGAKARLEAGSFAGKLLSFTALGDLNTDNGLPLSADVQRLPSGMTVFLDGDSELLFPGKGGGMALLQFIDKVEEEYRKN